MHTVHTTHIKLPLTLNKLKFLRNLNPLQGGSGQHPLDHLQGPAVRLDRCAHHLARLRRHTGPSICTRSCQFQISHGGARKDRQLCYDDLNEIKHDPPLWHCAIYALMAAL
jgi:hypothetical protein